MSHNARRERYASVRQYIISKAPIPPRLAALRVSASARRRPHQQVNAIRRSAELTFCRSAKRASRPHAPSARPNGAPCHAHKEQNPARSRRRIDSHHHTQQPLGLPRIARAASIVWRAPRARSRFSIRSPSSSCRPALSRHKLPPARPRSPATDCAHLPASMHASRPRRPAPASPGLQLHKRRWPRRRNRHDAWRISEAHAERQRIPRLLIEPVARPSN